MESNPNTQMTLRIDPQCDGRWVAVRINLRQHSMLDRYTWTDAQLRQRFGIAWKRSMTTLVEKGLYKLTRLGYIRTISGAQAYLFGVREKRLNGYS